MAFASSKLLNAAGARVRERLSQRHMIPLVEQVPGVSEPEQVAAMSALAGELSRVIGVDASYLRASETLREPLRVRREELASEIGELMPRVGLGEVVDPFAFDLLELVERRFREKPSRVERAAFSPMPKNEDEWIERILDLTVADFLITLA